MQNSKTRRDATAALRLAWPNRHTHPLRARMVIRSNVKALRGLKEAN